MNETIFIAASMSLQEEVKEWARRLRELDYDCDPRWVDHHWELPGGLENPRNHEQARRYAIEDFEDAAEANITIVIPAPVGRHNARLVEMGIGMVNSDEMWVIGSTTNNIYCTLNGLYDSPTLYVPYFRHFMDMEHALTYAEERLSE